MPPFDPPPYPSAQRKATKLYTLKWLHGLVARQLRLTDSEDKDAQPLSTDATALVTFVALEEDKLRFNYPPRFWRADLQKALRKKTPRHVTAAVKEAAGQGLLHYERSGPRAQTSYWTIGGLEYPFLGTETDQKPVSHEGLRQTKNKSIEDSSVPKEQVLGTPESFIQSPIKEPNKEPVDSGCSSSNTDERAARAIADHVARRHGVKLAEQQYRAFIKAVTVLRTENGIKLERQLELAQWYGDDKCTECMPPSIYSGDDWKGKFLSLQDAYKRWQGKGSADVIHYPMGVAIDCAPPKGASHSHSNEQKPTEPKPTDDEVDPYLTELLNKIR